MLSCQSRLCPPSLGSVYLGSVQGPEQTSCQISHTTIPPRLHILSYHSCHRHILRTQVHILLRPSPPLCWNTCIHQNTPPRHGTLIHRQVRVRPVSFIPHKDIRNRLSLWGNPPLLQNPQICRLIAINTPPWDGAGSGSGISASKNGGVWGGFSVEGYGSVSSVIAIIVVYIVGFFILVFPFLGSVNVFAFCEGINFKHIFLKNKNYKVTRWWGAFIMNLSYIWKQPNLMILDCNFLWLQAPSKLEIFKILKT